MRKTKHILSAKKRAITIKEIGNGVIKTLGFINLNIFDPPCIARKVTDDFPISTVGLLGWEVLKKYNGKINAGAKTLELGGHELPLMIKEEHIPLAPRCYQIIEANRTDLPNDKKESFSAIL